MRILEELYAITDWVIQSSMGAQLCRCIDCQYDSSPCHEDCDYDENECKGCRDARKQADEEYWSMGDALRNAGKKDYGDYS